MICAQRTIRQYWRLKSCWVARRRWRGERKNEWEASSEFGSFMYVAYLYPPRRLIHWLDGVGGLPVLHSLLQAPQPRLFRCCQSFWLQNGSGVYPPMTARRWEKPTIVSLHTILHTLDNSMQIPRHLDAQSQRP